MRLGSAIANCCELLAYRVDPSLKALASAGRNETLPATGAHPGTEPYSRERPAGRNEQSTRETAPFPHSPLSTASFERPAAGEANP